MGYASISGKARTDVNNPQAFGVCDRCGQWRNHVDLRWQFDYRGRTLQNIRILVCEVCEDDPQPQLKPRIIPPDPLPILNARVEPFCYDEEDDRYTSNPALPNVDVATVADTTLSGYQFVDGVQCTGGELVLVKNQTDASKNGIYQVNSGVWVLQGFDNETHQWYAAGSRNPTYYIQLGVYKGAVNVSRGLTQYAKLFQIDYADVTATLAAGTDVIIQTVSPSTVNHYDFYTGIYMAGADVRVTESLEPRSTQVVGAAAGSLNEIPGYTNLVPNICVVGKSNEVPYGCGTKVGLPYGFDGLPYSGPLWPTLQNQSIDVWINYFGLPSVWTNNIGTEVTFNANGFWPNPGPGASMRALGIGYDNHYWSNQFGLIDFWDNALNQPVDWMNGLRYPICPPGGDILWLSADCKPVEWYNNFPFNVNWGQVYPNNYTPPLVDPWPFLIANN